MRRHAVCTDALRAPGKALPTSVQGRPAVSRRRLIIAGGFEIPKSPWPVELKTPTRAPGERVSGSRADQSVCGSAYRLAGNERAYVAPSPTHFASCRLVRTSSWSTRTHPCIRRPRISMRRAFVVATNLSDCAGSTRTNTPPWPLAATAMLPRMRKASPPNIFFSVRSASPRSSSRMRSASSSSYATEAIVRHEQSAAPESFGRSCVILLLFRRR
jgi:hypothetical protein